MVYQYVREPLRMEEADRLSQACETGQEKLIVTIQDVLNSHLLRNLLLYFYHKQPFFKTVID